MAQPATRSTTRTASADAVPRQTACDVTALGLLASLLTLSALFGVLNARTLRLPNATGVLVFALLTSLVLVLVDPLIPAIDLQAWSRRVLGTIDLPRALLDDALSFLLFAGALQVDLGHLWARKFSVLALAVLGTLLAVALFGGAMWFVFAWIGLSVPLVWCIVLGAILAPTDPVSVAGMLRRLGLPGPLQAVFAGESLFNDGIGVVVASVALGVATAGGANMVATAGGANIATAGSGAAIGAAGIITRFLVEAGGGSLLGLLLGAVATWFMRAVKDAQLELIISLALATGAFTLADALGTSGPIAVVVAGLSMGARPSLTAISLDGHKHLMTFWSLIDEVLNALLFLLIGFEVLAVALHRPYVVAILVAIPLSLVVRATSVLIATAPIRLPWRERQGALVVLTWGGLRGGISVALALGLPQSPVRPVLLATCYGVVVFTIVVQGLLMEPVARRFFKLENSA